MMIPAVFTASLSSLFYEILLSYFFAETQWNNLYFFVISISLFGYSAGGIIINLFTGTGNGDVTGFFNRLISVCLFILAAGIILSYVAVNGLGIDYFRIPFEKRLLLLLVLQYCILAIPFTAAGMIIAAGFASGRSGTHRVYTGTMTGSAAGVLLAFLVIPRFGTAPGVLFCSLPPLLIHCFRRKTGLLTRCVAVLFSLIVSACFLLDPPVLQPVVSTYKSLSTILASKDSVLIDSCGSIHGRVDIVESPLLRASPGLSLTFRGNIPAGRAAVLNAERTLLLYDYEADSSFTAYTLPAAVSALDRSYDTALVIEKGNGAAIPQAVAAGCRAVHVLETVPELAGILSRSITLPGVHVYTAPPRSMRVRDPGPFDLIFPDDQGSSLPGLRSLDEQYHLTTEAFEGYLGSLSSHGLIVLTRRLDLPPTDSVRLFRTALRALETSGVREPRRHLYILRNWNSYCLLVSACPFEPGDYAALKTFTENMGFDPVYYEGITIHDVNRYNVFEKPYHWLAMVRSLTGNKSVFNTRPRSDAAPYVSSFLRPRFLKESSTALGGRSHILLCSGEILVWILLAAALTVAIGFLIIPVLLVPGVRREIHAGPAVYFSLLGFAFMFVETAFIKLMAMPAGDCLVSFSLVLSVILIVSAAGSYIGRNISPGRLFHVTVILGAVLFATAFLGSAVIDTLLHLPKAVLYAGLVICTALPGFAMGIPFPAGLRLFTPTPTARAYSWAANGVFSVLSSIIAIPVSLYAGVPALFAAAGAAYLAAGLLTRVLVSNP